MSEVEERAADLGWTPKEAWVEKGGDPDKWRSAEKFMEYGEQNVAFVRKSMEKEMDAKLAKATKDFDDRVAKLENVTSTAITAAADKAEEQRQGLIKRWTAHKAKAADDENLAEFNKADVALKALEGKAPQNADTQQTGPSSESTAFHTKMMPLINQSTDVQKFADDAAITIRRDNPNMQEADYFKELETRISEKFGDDFPQFFGRQAKRPAAVDSSDGDSGGGDGKSYADLPPEAKKVCNEFVKDKVLTKEQYVSSYFGE